MSSVISSVPIQLTPSALAEIKRLASEQYKGKLLRFGVKGGGCSGLSYILEFDDPKDGDLHFEIDGVACVMEPSHGMYLTGMEVHWDNGLNNRGFVFTNPNASTTCGCGTSFAV